MHIYLDKTKSSYKPFQTFTARPIPLHFKDEAQKVISKFIDSGVIERVHEPTEWISPGFFVPKPDGSVRLVVDYTKLNQHVDRPVHPFPCPQDCIRQLKPDSRFFMKLDAVQGYYQIPLDEESSRITTFLLHDGRYKFLRAPMGLNPSGDEWCFRSDMAFEGLDILKIVDDVLIQGPDEASVLRTFEQVLERCSRFNLTLSRKKLELGQKVKFAGFIISGDGASPDPDKLRAISDFPVPKDLSALRSFLGMVAQLNTFISNV